MACVDAALVQKVFNVAQRQRKSDIHQHTKLDDLRRGFELAERVLGHFQRLRRWKCLLKTGYAVTANCRLPRLRTVRAHG